MGDDWVWVDHSRLQDNFVCLFVQDWHQEPQPEPTDTPESSTPTWVPIPLHATLQSVAKSCAVGEDAPHAQWRGVWDQFLRDYPRQDVTLDGAHHPDPRDFIRHLLHATQNKRIVRKVVVMCTQGILADIYQHISTELQQADTRSHLVDGGRGAITIFTHPRCRMDLHKPFQHIRMNPSGTPLIKSHLTLHLHMALPATAQWRLI